MYNITIRDAPMWNLRPAFMDYVHIFNVTILAPDSASKVSYNLLHHYKLYAFSTFGVGSGVVTHLR